MRILYIEDIDLNFKVMEAMVQAFFDWPITHARNGTEGIQLATQDMFDLILLDINLPDISGLEVMNRLNNDSSFKKVPVIAVSADATPDTKQQAFDVGCKGYITKPIDVNKFKKTLQDIRLK